MLYFFVKKCWRYLCLNNVLITINDKYFVGSKSEGKKNWVWGIEYATKTLNGPKTDTFSIDHRILLESYMKMREFISNLD